jgi:hypothetical protein
MTRTRSAKSAELKGDAVKVTEVIAQLEFANPSRAEMVLHRVPMEPSSADEWRGSTAPKAPILARACSRA